MLRALLLVSNPMKIASLQVKLLLLVVVSLGVPLAVVLVSLVRVYGATQELDRISRQDFLAQETVLRATIRFKQQVQEWKNVLLRGNHAEDLDKYWGNFTARENDVRSAIAQAREAISQEDLRMKLDEFRAAHEAAGQGYRRGLDAYKASGFQADAGDKAVAGVDRAPTELLLAAENVARERGAATVAAAVHGARTAFITAIASSVIVVVLAIGVLWFFMRRSVVQPIREAMGFASRIAEGDLTGRIQARSHDEVGQLLQALSGMNESLKEIVRRMRTAAESVAVASGQVAAGTTSLSQQTEEQASSLEETAASMEELATTVQQNAASARKGDELARNASATAQAGGNEVRNVVQTMGEISTASRQIADIVSVIDAIAFQTNILALNAAVEAARAGDQGRGFAVVAAEVRTLAQRSAGAAKEIKTLIERSTNRVDAGAALVERAGATIDKMVADVTQVTELMSSIAEASAEQARGVQQVNRTVTEMDKTVQHNASSVQESAAAAEGMRRQAGEMVEAVSRFRLDGDDALARMPRAAAQPAHGSTGGATLAPLPQPAAKRAVREPALAAAAGEEWKEF